MKRDVCVGEIKRVYCILEEGVFCAKVKILSVDKKEIKGVIVESRECCFDMNEIVYFENK